MSERDESGGRGNSSPRDEYYYEIQLSNKQLVFYFLAGATGLILSFLAGIMVGRGVDAGANEPRSVREEPVVAVTDDASRKAAAATAAASPSPEALSYPQLESEKVNDRLEPTPGPAPAGKPPAAKPTAAPAPAAKPSPAAASKAPPAPVAAPKSAPSPVRVAQAATPTPVPTPVPPKATPAPKPTPTPAPKVTPAQKPGRAPAAPVAAAEAGALSIQVGAFKDKATADGVSAQLRRKGYPAHVMSPEGGGLFNVRVGPYANRGEAERIKTRLEQQEKFKPFIVKQ